MVLVLLLLESSTVYGVANGMWRMERTYAIAIVITAPGDGAAIDWVHLGGLHPLRVVRRVVCPPEPLLQEGGVHALSTLGRVAIVFSQV